MPEPLVTVEDVVIQLGHRLADGRTSVDLLRAYRAQVEAEAALLEAPQAVLDYLDFFIPAFEEVLVALEGLIDALPQRIRRSDVELLRLTAANCRTEQLRCLQFRDRCINRPLPHEEMRRLLNDISVTSRDQLTAFADLEAAARRLEAIGPQQVRPEGGDRDLGRRDLFSRVLRPLTRR